MYQHDEPDWIPEDDRPLDAFEKTVAVLVILASFAIAVICLGAAWLMLF
jgi:hypothetical protein